MGDFLIVCSLQYYDIEPEWIPWEYNEVAEYKSSVHMSLVQLTILLY